MRVQSKLGLQAFAMYQTCGDTDRHQPDEDHCRKAAQGPSMNGRHIWSAFTGREDGGR